MKPGRKPQSPAEHKARGTFKNYRHASLIDGDAPDDLPVAPHWLTPAGQEAWLDLVPRVTRARRGCELDSYALATLANLVGACAIAWGEGSAPPSSYLGEMRRLQEMFGLGGVPSRVLAAPVKADGPNPFLVNGRKPPGA